MLSWVMNAGVSAFFYGAYNTVTNPLYIERGISAPLFTCSGVLFMYMVRFVILLQEKGNQERK